MRSMHSRAAHGDVCKSAHSRYPRRFRSYATRQCRLPTALISAKADAQASQALPQVSTNESWPKKSSLYILRTDGKSCSRELVSGSGTLSFAYPSTQQQMLIWKDRPKSVMVIKKLGHELEKEYLETIEFLGKEHGQRVVVEPEEYKTHLAHRKDMDYVYTFDQADKGRLGEFVDYIVCLGGDGVILHTSSLFQAHMPPVIAFNLGSLGFMTNHAFADMRKDLHAVIFGNSVLSTCMSGSVDEKDENKEGVMITLRMRLTCEIYRKGSDVPEQTHEVVNEVVLDRGANSYLTNIECYERNRFLTRVQADGIILSTPTGSTAYAVSAGGSMVHPNVPAILLTPVCPHSLSFRPVILPDYVDLELRIPESSRSGGRVSFDGRNSQELKQGDRLKVRMSERPLPTINKVDLTEDWFNSLSRCFRWSDRLAQKALQENGDPNSSTVNVSALPTSAPASVEQPPASHSNGADVSVALNV